MFVMLPILHHNLPWISYEARRESEVPSSYCDHPEVGSCSSRRSPPNQMPANFCLCYLIIVAFLWVVCCDLRRLCFKSSAASGIQALSWSPGCRQVLGNWRSCSSGQKRPNLYIAKAVFPIGLGAACRAHFHVLHIIHLLLICSYNNLTPDFGFGWISRVRSWTRLVSRGARGYHHLWLPS